MRYYYDGENTVWFTGCCAADPDFSDYRKERRLLNNIINSCIYDGYDPFKVLTAFCLSDMAAYICMESHLGYFYGEGRFLHDMWQYGVLEKCNEVIDISRFHWIIDLYLTARHSLGMTYWEIVSKYPVRDCYNLFNPLHETSEANALSKMNFVEQQMCGCIINNKYYLFENEVPEEKKYLLEKKEQSSFRNGGLLYLNTVFFHLVNEPNGYLSNWYPSVFSLDSQRFNCVEQYMMWKKALLFNDKETAEKILKESDPVAIKKLGREVKGYIDSKWASLRYNIVSEALYAKFSQNEDLKEQFLATSGIFAECAVNDKIWGIGLGMNDPKRFNRPDWNGSNLLGFALEDVYNKIKEEASKSHVF